ncbi:hypothetical protein ALC53_01504 [Atta colombica]|uniref:Uncharacterized protein n=1 Tax=Atta colombica TaxID=520822 RepID=A0A195BTK7_9HYME|nr:hypothetical protein ALC53_01504 [Atta colombica]
MCNNCSSICYPSEFFPNIQGNLTKITWAHGVNSLTELDKALASAVPETSVSSGRFLRAFLHAWFH